MQRDPSHWRSADYPSAREDRERLGRKMDRPAASRAVTNLALAHRATDDVEIFGRKQVTKGV